MTIVEMIVEAIVIMAKRVVVADDVTNTTTSTEIGNVAVAVKSMAENTKDPADIAVVEVGDGLVLLNRMIFPHHHPLMTILRGDLGQGHLPTKKRNEKSRNVNIVVTVVIEETTMTTTTTTTIEEVVVGAEVIVTTVERSMMIDKEEEEEEPHRCHLHLLHSTM